MALTYRSTRAAADSAEYLSIDDDGAIGALSMNQQLVLGYGIYLSVYDYLFIGWEDESPRRDLFEVPEVFWAAGEEDGSRGFWSH